METRQGLREEVSLRVISTIDESMKDGISLANGNRFNAHACNISVGGIGLLTKYFLPKGLLLEIEIEGRPLGLQKRIIAKGEVTHSRSVKVHQYRSGVKFTSIADKHVKTIAQFISENERRKSLRMGLSSPRSSDG